MDRYRLIALVATALAFVGGLAALRSGIRDTLAGSESTHWPTAPGVIIESSVTFTETEQTVDREYRGSSGASTRTVETWFPVVKYTYAANGHQLTGAQIKIVDLGSSERKDAVAEAAKYSVGAKVTVFYDPTNETKSLLDPGISSGAVTPIIIGTLWCLCCAGTAVFLCSRFAKQLVIVMTAGPGTRIYDRDGNLITEKRREQN